MAPQHSIFAAAGSPCARPSQPVCRHGARRGRARRTRADSIDARRQPSPLQTGVWSLAARTWQQLAVQGAADPDGPGHHRPAGRFCHGAHTRSLSGRYGGAARGGAARLDRGAGGHPGSSADAHQHSDHGQRDGICFRCHARLGEHASSPGGRDRRGRARCGRGLGHRGCGLALGCAGHHANGPAPACAHDTHRRRRSGRATSRGPSHPAPRAHRASHPPSCDKARSGCGRGAAGSDVHPHPRCPHGRRQTAPVRPAATERSLHQGTLIRLGGAPCDG